MRCRIIIPVYNQWLYTKQCLKSVAPSIPEGADVLVIDNASSDETAARLSQMQGISVISNAENLGFAKAINQGIEASPAADWYIFLNNDVLVSRDWFSGLIDAADEHDIDVISPAMREGPLNYDLEDRAVGLRRVLGNHLRRGMAHGVCFAVRGAVFATVGRFDEAFRIGQYEEADFYRRVKQADFSLAVTGRSFIHHFSSVTQKAISRTSSSGYGEQNQKYYRKKWRLNWLKRKKEKLQDAIILKRYIRKEKRLANTVLVDRSV